jgi:DNA segregation ATPase FtsK/SpoIIIE-like protein
VIGYELIAPKPEEIFSGKSEDGISVSVGMKADGSLVKLELGQEGGQHNALVVGTVGSGKSKFLHTVIVDALQRYSAEELEIYLIDFKEGVEFAQYADYKIPNFKAIGLDSEQEFGVDVLKELKKLTNKRATDFFALRSNIVDIKNYNRRVNTLKEQGMEDVPKKIPRVLLIMDEFHVLFSANNPELANKAKAYLAEIIREGRAFGIHVILSTQSMEEITNNIDADTLGQITTRFAFKCSEDVAKAVLGDEADAIAQVEKNDPGSAIFRSNIWQRKDAEHFKVAYIDTEKPLFGEILSDLQGKYAAKGIDAETKILVSDLFPKTSA